jgi:phage FluMu protein Com
MSEDKKFCPKCKAVTIMEPAEGIQISPEEFERAVVTPLAFEGRLTPYQCPVCKHLAFIPEGAGAQTER